MKVLMDGQNERFYSSLIAHGRKQEVVIQNQSCAFFRNIHIIFLVFHTGSRPVVVSLLEYLPNHIGLKPVILGLKGLFVAKHLFE